jgi:hypothetical protein
MDDLPQQVREHINALEAALHDRGERLTATIKLLNRLEASITHHRKGKLFGVDTSDDLDEALWAARDRILSAAHSKDLASLGQIGIDTGCDTDAPTAPNSRAAKLASTPGGQQELGEGGNAKQKRR